MAALGTLARQPAIAAHCMALADERDTIIESLLMQKVGSNPKAMKQYKERPKASAISIDRRDETSRQPLCGSNSCHDGWSTDKGGAPIPLNRGKEPRLSLAITEQRDLRHLLARNGVDR